MVWTPQALALLATFMIHALLFWDAPRQRWRARREARLSRSRAYGIANGSTIVLILAAGVTELAWGSRPAFHPVGGPWTATAWFAVGAGVLYHTPRSMSLPIGVSLMTSRPWCARSTSTRPNCSKPLLSRPPRMW